VARAGGPPLHPGLRSRGAWRNRARHLWKDRLELLKPFVSLSSILAALLCSTWVCAQTPDTASSPRTLKKLSLEELMALEVTVTSVSRRPEKLSETASAIQVITQDDIRRSAPRACRKP